MELVPQTAQTVRCFPGKGPLRCHTAPFTHVLGTTFSLASVLRCPDLCSHLSKRSWRSLLHPRERASWRGGRPREPLRGAGPLPPGVQMWECHAAMPRDTEATRDTWEQVVCAPRCPHASSFPILGALHRGAVPVPRASHAPGPSPSALTCLQLLRAPLSEDASPQVTRETRCHSNGDRFALPTPGRLPARAAGAAG